MRWLVFTNMERVLPISIVMFAFPPSILLISNSNFLLPFYPKLLSLCFHPIVLSSFTWQQQHPCDYHLLVTSSPFSVLMVVGSEGSFRQRSSASSSDNFRYYIVFHLLSLAAILLVHPYPSLFFILFNFLHWSANTRCCKFQPSVVSAWRSIYKIIVVGRLPL